MIRRSPAEYYIKYMILHPSMKTDEDIVRDLRERQLDYPGGKYLERLRSKLVKPANFDPLNETDSKSYKFLHKHKVNKLFFPDTYTREAVAILETPKAKEIVEAMLIAEEPTFVISKRLERFNLRVSMGGVEHYEHFFFNTKLVDPTELRALIDLRVDDMLLDADMETAARHKALKHANYSDARYQSVNSSTPYVAALRLQMRHGLMPTKVDYGRLAECVRMAALLAAYETLGKMSPRAAADARDFATVAATMDALLVAKGGGTSELQNSMQSIALAVDRGRVPTIASLTSGNFTDSIELVSANKEG